jgi:predicted component of type VI protein secretion system
VLKFITIRSVMANLTIPFPEGTRTVILRGSRITIGRLPENTIQVRDRTVSAHHAELILEGGQYRVHDLDATNGILINGKQVWDFHLHEPCTIQFGGIECRFGVEDPAPEAPGEVDPLPARGEVNAIRNENTHLKATVASLRQQVDAMTAVRAADDAGSSAMVNVDQLATERAALQQKVRDREAEMEKLKDSLAVIRRDRDNLQRAYDDAKGTSARIVTAPPPSALATPVATPVTSAVPQATPPRLPKPPTSLGTTNASNASNGTANPPPPPTTPVRRPASGIQLPPVRVISPKATPQPVDAEPVAAGAVATGPRGTQKLVE